MGNNGIHTVEHVQWNLSNPDTIGPDKSVLIREVSLASSEVEMYTSTVLGEGKCVLFRNVSLIRGVPFREVPLSAHKVGICSWVCTSTWHYATSMWSVPIVHGRKCQYSETSL